MLEVTPQTHRNRRRWEKFLSRSGSVNVLIGDCFTSGAAGISGSLALATMRGPIMPKCQRPGYEEERVAVGLPVPPAPVPPTS